MAVDRTPVLKRCRSLGLDPIYLGIDKKSNKTVSETCITVRLSEYGTAVKRKTESKIHLRRT